MSSGSGSGRRTSGTPGSSRLLDGDHRAARRGWHTIELDGFGSRWFRVGGLDDILGRRGW